MNKNLIYKEKQKIALMSVFVNIFLFCIKFVAGVISHSQILIVDAFHSLSDLAAAGSVYVGIRIANKKTKDFPYGLYKLENIVAIFSSFVIFLAGYEIVRQVFIEGRLEKVINIYAALGAVLVTIVVTLLFSIYERKKGEELNSPSLIADAEHIKTDMWSSVVVVIGIVADYFGIYWLEKLAVVIVALFIFRAGFEILSESIKVLLDVSIDYETLEKVKNIILSFPKAKGIKSLKGRNSGSYKFIEGEILIDSESFEFAHELTDEIERRIKEEVPFVEKVIFHAEPFHSPKKVIAVPVNSNNKIIKDRFCECDFIMVFKIDTERKLIEDTKIYVNTVKREDKQKGIKFAEFLNGMGVDCLVLSKPPENKGLLYAMIGEKIKVCFINDGFSDAYELVDYFLKNDIKCFSPTKILEDMREEDNES